MINPKHIFYLLALGMLMAAMPDTAYAQTLHEAVKFGIKADVEAMLAKGANVNGRNENGQTPLFALGEIFRGGHPFPKEIDPKGIAELLLAKGADVNAKDNGGNTPLHAVVRGGEKDAVELLLAKGANVNAKNNDGETPLHSASNEGVAKWLLAKGADVNAKNNNGETPLFNAIYKAVFFRQNFITLLLAHGADVNAKDNGGQTPLRKAASYFASKEIREMLENPAPKQKPNPRELFGQLIEQLKNKPNEESTRQQIITLAQDIKPAPAIPEEAEKFEGRAQYAFRAAKSETEYLDAAHEYLKAIEVAPWVAHYYFNLCQILEKANRPAEAARACKLYLVAAPQADDASSVRQQLAGLEYALERERGSITKRVGCIDMDNIYNSGARVAQIGNLKISVKLYSVLRGGVWHNQLGIYDITTLPNNIVGQRVELNPVDKNFQLDDRITGTPWFRLTIGSDGQITFGGYSSPLAEIVTSTNELYQLRNKQLRGCYLAVKDGNFFIETAQGGPLKSNNGDRVNGLLYFASDCKGNLIGDKPGNFPSVFIPHPETPGITAAQSSSSAQGLFVALSDACQQDRKKKDNLGWLSE